MFSYDRISIYGVLKVMPDLFDEFALPSGLDRENVLNNIVLEATELELYYSEPEFLKDAIGIWSHKRLPVWERIMETLNMEYNPIENYDRKENWTDSGSGTNTEESTSQGSNESQDNTTSTGSSEGETRNEVVSNANSINNSEQINKVNGFNSPNMTDHDKNEGSSVSESVDTSENSGSSLSTTESEVIGRKTGSDSRTDSRTGNTSNQSEHSGRVHGNVGVTTNATMVSEEVNLRMTYEIVEIITNDFIKQFCLRVY